MDNTVFNVNGIGKDRLQATISLVLSGRHSPVVTGWQLHPQKGFIMLWTVEEKDHRHHLFPTKLNAEQITSIVWDWLQDPEKTKGIRMEGWDADTDHDGDNKLGWRVYCEEWGQVDKQYHAIAAIKPAYMWYGK